MRSRIKIAQRATLVTLAVFTFAGCSGVFAGCSGGREHPPLNAQQQRGQQVFQADCAVCHFADSNRPRGGPGLQDLFHKKYLPSGAPANDDRVRQTILMGRGNMPHFDQILDDQQMNDLLAYLHTL